MSTPPTTQTWIRAELIAVGDTPLAPHLIIPADALEFQGPDLVFHCQGEVVHVAETARLRSITWLGRNPALDPDRRKSQWPKHGLRWTDEEREDLRTQLVAGNSWTSIAKSHGRSRSGVQQEALKQGWVTEGSYTVKDDLRPVEAGGEPPAPPGTTGSATPRRRQRGSAGSDTDARGIPAVADPDGSGTAGLPGDDPAASGSADSSTDVRGIPAVTDPDGSGTASWPGNGPAASGSAGSSADVHGDSAGSDLNRSGGSHRPGGPSTGQLSPVDSVGSGVDDPDLPAARFAPDGPSGGSTESASSGSAGSWLSRFPSALGGRRAEVPGQRPEGG